MRNSTSLQRLRVLDDGAAARGHVARGDRDEAGAVGRGHAHRASVPAEKGDRRAGAGLVSDANGLAPATRRLEAVQTGGGFEGRDRLPATAPLDEQPERLHALIKG